MLAAVLLLVLLGGASAEYFRVDPATGQIKDDQGRVRIFHGTNAVEKVFPFVPPTESFDTARSVSAQDASNLQGWGFNVVRLGVLWVGAFPEEGKLNTTYLDEIRKVVRVLHEKNIYTILDMHQDVLNERMCGEGIPTWALDKGLELVGFDRTGSKAFPAPLKMSLPIDPSTGYPKVSECMKHTFAEYYLSYQSMAAWKALYEYPEMWQIFGDFWVAVASAFKDEPGVLAYELLNEPSPTEANSSLLPSFSDKKLLQNMYTHLHDRIREVDANTLIMFEPLVLDSYLSDVGYTTDFPEFGPGNASTADRLVYAYHIYCSNNKAGTPSPLALCLDFLIPKAWAGAERGLKKLKVGGFLSEWGAMADDEGSWKAIRKQAEEADKRFQGWAYWTFKSFDDITTQNPASETFYSKNGTLQHGKVKALARPYAPIIAGHAQLMEFDQDHSQLTLRYTMDEKITGVTEVYVNPEYYPSGVNMTATPSGVKVSFSKKPHHYIIDHSGANPGSTVTVIARPQ